MPARHSLITRHADDHSVVLSSKGSSDASASALVGSTSSIFDLLPSTQTSHRLADLLARLERHHAKLKVGCRPLSFPGASNMSER
jgi:hypothetical protein